MERFSEPLEPIDKANELINDFGTVNCAIEACDNMLYIFRYDQFEYRFWKSVKQELLNLK